MVGRREDSINGGASAHARFGQPARRILRGRPRKSNVTLPSIGLKGWRSGAGDVGIWRAALARRQNPMPDETRLREGAHEAIRSSKLPSRPADRIVRRRGWSGLSCPVCIEPVKRDEVQVEIQFRRPDSTLGSDSYQLHPLCFAAWEFERTKIGATPLGPPLDTGEGDVPMQVKCSKCSEPIALTDIIESSDGHLSHMDCKRPQTLTAEERALLFDYCTGHASAYCLRCDLRFRLDELAADMLGSRTNLCPRCHNDLTASARAHLFSCAMLPSEVRLRAREVREAAQRLVKQSQQARDRSDVLIREAEAALFERQRALREVMAQRTAS